MAIRQQILNKHGLFGTTGRILMEYVLTPVIFYGITYAFLYVAQGFVAPKVWIPFCTLALGMLCYRSIHGIHAQFFTKR